MAEKTKNVKIEEEEWLELVKLKLERKSKSISEVIKILRVFYINQKKKNEKEEELGSCD